MTGPGDRHGALDAVRRAARALPGDQHDHDELLDLIGEASVVLLGEASHGTHEFYRERARITRRLIVERGFRAVAIEGDWPDACRVNRFVRDPGGDTDAEDALAGFERFPTWMWRNTLVAAFVDWLRGHNARLSPGERCGFYGLDLYALHTSIAAVLGHLDESDPAAAARARERCACFDAFGGDSQVYGLMAGLGTAGDCEDAVVRMLVEMAHRSGAARAAAGSAGDDAAESAFDAEQNARRVRNAEAYWRAMYRHDLSSWNLRDDHMASTLEAIRGHLGGPTPAKVVVWAHNAHVGDARATEMGAQRGEISLGQRARERLGAGAVLVGFTGHCGTVTAASEWGGPAARMRVTPGRDDSLEGLLHATGVSRLLLPLRGDRRLAQALEAPRLQRAIGVL